MRAFFAVLGALCTCIGLALDVDSSLLADLESICSSTAESTDNRINHVCARISRSKPINALRRDVAPESSAPAFKSSPPRGRRSSNYCTIPGCFSGSLTRGVRNIQCNASARVPANVSEDCPDYNTAPWALTLTCNDGVLDNAFAEFISARTQDLTLQSDGSCCSVFNNRNWTMLNQLTLDCVASDNLFDNSHLGSLAILDFKRHTSSFHQLLQHTSLATLAELKMAKLGLVSLPPSAFSTLTHLSNLDLRNNNLTSLPGNLFTTTTHLGTLDLSGNLITTLPPLLFQASSQLSYLNLAHNLIHTLVSTTLHGATRLNYLDMSFNLLSTLPSNTFAPLTSLTTLNLAANELPTLNADWLATLRNLNELYVPSNSLTSLAGVELNALQSLARLHLAHNALSSIGSKLFQRLTHLEELTLSNNNLRSVDCVMNIKSNAMHTLTLDSNHFSTIPPTLFIRLRNLITVNMARNELTVLPKGLFRGLTRLNTVTLHSNRIQTLPADLFDGANQLSTVNLADNAIHSLDPAVFANSPKLSTIDLSDNHLVHLPPTIFASHTQLDSVLLQRNSLRTLPAVFDQSAASLYKIDLSANFITQVDDRAFVHLSELKHLNLASNVIHKLSRGQLSGLKDVDRLDLSDNRLSDLPEGTFTWLTELQELRLDQNQLTTLDVAWGLNLRLTTLSVGYNNLQSVSKTFFTDLTKLESLTLRHNDLLAGSAPLDILSQLSKLSVLDISYSYDETEQHATASIKLPLSLSVLRMTQVPAGPSVLDRIASMYNLEYVSLGSHATCSSGGKLRLRTAHPLQLFEVHHTSCAAITAQVAADTGIVRIVNNPELVRVSVQASGTLQHLDVSKNPKLTDLSTAHVSSLDISYTRLPYQNFYCKTAGTAKFQAQGMLAPETYKDNLHTLLDDCFRAVQLLDLSHNDFMNAFEVVNATFGKPFLLDTQLQAPEVYHNFNWETVQTLSTFPTVAMIGLPLECDLQASWIEVRDKQVGTLEAWPFNYYECKCKNGYTLSGPVCERDLTIGEQGWAVALLTALLVLVLGGMVVFFVKRQALLRHDIDVARLMASTKHHLLKQSSSQLDGEEEV